MFRGRETYQIFLYIYKILSDRKYSQVHNTRGALNSWGGSQKFFSKTNKRGVLIRGGSEIDFAI